jgi:hypothetical protein
VGVSWASWNPKTPPTLPPPSIPPSRPLLTISLKMRQWTRARATMTFARSTHQRLCRCGVTLAAASAAALAQRNTTYNMRWQSLDATNDCEKEPDEGTQHDQPTVPRRPPIQLDFRRLSACVAGRIHVYSGLQRTALRTWRISPPFAHH